MYYDQIASIKEVGETDVFDLTVAANKNFLLSNGILSHNSGKSMVASSINWQTATLYERYAGGDQRDYFGVDKICANESEYAYKVKEAKFGQTFQVDEQREAKFQMGSVREELYINSAG